MKRTIILCSLLVLLFVSGCTQQPDTQQPSTDNKDNIDNKIICGNSQVETGEECDGTNLAGKKCTDLNYDSGTLKCINCKFDISNCAKKPKNIIEYKQGWNIEAIVSSFNLDYSPLVLNSNGNPSFLYGSQHVYYVGNGLGDCENNSNWICKTSFTEDSIVNSQAAIDSNNKIHAVYHLSHSLCDICEIKDKTVKYAKNDGNKWNVEIVDNEKDSDGGYPTNPSITVDKNNNPHIAYTSNKLKFDAYEGTKGKLKYAKYDGSGWSKEIVDSDGEIIGNPSIAVDSNNNPYILYEAKYYVNNMGVTFDYKKLKYAHFVGSGGNCGQDSDWKCEVVANDIILSDSYYSIVVDSNNNPHIEYSSSDGLQYASYDGNKWNTKTIQDKRSCHFSSMTLDKNGNPHISYYNGNDYKQKPENELKHAYYDGSKWNTETVARTWVFARTSIAVDNNGNVNIIYPDRISKTINRAFFME